MNGELEPWVDVAIDRLFTLTTWTIIVLLAVSLYRNVTAGAWFSATATGCLAFFMFHMACRGYGARRTPPPCPDRPPF